VEGNVMFVVALKDAPGEVLATACLFDWACMLAQRHADKEGKDVIVLERRQRPDVPQAGAVARPGRRRCWGLRPCVTCNASGTLGWDEKPGYCWRCNGKRLEEVDPW
jgi:hypothetical protein